jgi:methyl-accepting chemotaxis protein
MRVPFRHSLAGRLVLFGVAPTLLLVAAIVALAASDRHRVERSHVERELAGAARHTLASAERRVELAHHASRLLAETVSSLGLSDPQAIGALLARLVETAPEASGAWIVVEPATSPSDADRTPIALRAVRGLTGATLASDPELADELPSIMANSLGAAENAEHRPVRRGSVRSIEARTGIARGDRVVGAVGVEVSLDALHGLMASDASELGVSVILLDADDRMIVTSVDRDPPSRATGSALVDRPIADSPLAGFQPALRESRRLGATVTDVDPIGGEAVLLATAEGTTSGLRVAVTRPEREALGAVGGTVARGFAAALVGLALLGTLLVSLALSVRRRIDSAVRAAERIAQGDLTVRIDADGHRDESGALLTTLATMADRLHALVARVQAAGRTLDGSVVELAKSTVTQKHAATPLGQTTAEVAAAAREIGATGTELARTMESVQLNAAATADLAKRGRDQLRAVDGSMRELDAATTSVAGKLATINERAVAITTVVTTISKVADQTNLLSVNAAIEAEKAGEQGRGFLVVAREIRRLADQTAESTLNIARLVEEMQTAVSAGVMEMDRFADKVRRGVDDVNETSRQMGAIIGQVAENTERFRAVSEGMASQSAGAVQISEAASHLQQSARSAIDGLARLSATARSIEGATSALQAEVAAFRLVERAA